MEHLGVSEMMALVGSDIQVKWHPDYYDNVVSGAINAQYLIVRVAGSMKKDEYVVVLEHVPSGSVQERWVDNDGLGKESGDPMLIMADVMPDLDDPPLSKEALKKANSRHNATKCAKCGGPLKEPFLNVKHCPVCEP